MAPARGARREAGQRAVVRRVLSPLPLERGPLPLSLSFLTLQGLSTPRTGYPAPYRAALFPALVVVEVFQRLGRGGGGSAPDGA